ncbi:hypothetical protein GCM10027596_32100 [Nocardioides korecus]
MYVSVSRLQVPVEQCDEVIDAFRDRAGLVDAFPGFHDLEVWRSDKVREPARDAGAENAGVPTQEVWMVSRWETREHFTAYMRSAEHRVSHDRIDPGLHRAIHLERLEQLHGTYDVVAR